MKVRDKIPAPREIFKAVTVTAADLCVQLWKSVK